MERTRGDKLIFVGDQHRFVVWEHNYAKSTAGDQIRGTAWRLVEPVD